MNRGFPPVRTATTHSGPTSGGQSGVCRGPIWGTWGANPGYTGGQSGVAIFGKPFIRNGLGVVISPDYPDYTDYPKGVGSQEGADRLGVAGGRSLSGGRFFAPSEMGSFTALTQITARAFSEAERPSGTPEKTGKKTGKTAEKTAKSCGESCDGSHADVQVKPGFEIADPRFLPALCGAGGRRPHAGGPARRGRPRASCPDSGQTLILAPV
jgi:hypothetical protein